MGVEPIRGQSIVWKPIIDSILHRHGMGDGVVVGGVVKVNVMDHWGKSQLKCPGTRQIRTADLSVQSNTPTTRPP